MYVCIEREVNSRLKYYNLDVNFNLHCFFHIVIHVMKSLQLCVCVGLYIAYTYAHKS